MRVLAISGSLRAGSNNSALLRALREGAPTDIEVVLYESLKQIPPYDSDDDIVPGPASVEALRQAIREADGVLFATPEYNSSIPGSLKNALDWASRPLATNVLRNKPVAVISSSAGAFGGVWAAAELRKVLGATGSRVAEVELAVGHAHEKFDDEGHLMDDDVRQGLANSLSTLADSVAARAELAA